MLTKQDKKYLFDTFVTKEDLAELDIKITGLEKNVSHLPTKDDFAERMDKISGQLQAISDEQTLHQGQHDRINDRFDRIDKHLNISTLDD